MENNNYFSGIITVFHDRLTPEPGILAGYAALIQKHQLKVPLPCKLCLISRKHKKYETDNWMIFTPRHEPDPTLFGNLSFALKYEGIDLLILKTLFKLIDKETIISIIQQEPTGIYARKIWFLYEWLLDIELNIPALQTGNFVDLLDTDIQFPGQAEVSKRHRIRNNLPGVKEFCPLIRKTKIIEDYIEKINQHNHFKSSISYKKDLLLRASAFLLLKDSKASYAIEGENPSFNRALSWGRIIAEAGIHPLSKNELLRLQKTVIENHRFIKMGCRTEGGFVGEHDRETGTPLPRHISAKWQDIDTLIEGLLNTNTKLESTDFHPVLAASLIAFGFVFIHPFVDGNGRIHRYIIHHLLAKKGFTPPGIVFPISAAMLEDIHEYRKVLESFSQPRLELIEWEPTSDHNVEVINETIDLYAYFDATELTEFLLKCVLKTVEHILPQEIKYLENYDQLKNFLDNHFDFPDAQVALLVKFLEQGNGKLSKRAREKEFKLLTLHEIELIENKFREIFS